MIIPGFIINILTFPGVIVHEAAHMLFCKLRGVAVLDVCFFRVGNPSGYVIHELTDDFTTAFAIAVGPFLINSLFCMLICFPAVFPVKIFEVYTPVTVLLLWLGLSIGMHAFPSTGDAKNLYRQARTAAANGSILAIICFPIVGLIYAGNVLSIIWADLAYGAAIGLGLPALLL